MTAAGGAVKRLAAASGKTTVVRGGGVSESPRKEVGLEKGAALMPVKSKKRIRKTPAKVELLEVDGAYGLARDGRLLKTPKENPLVHPSRELLRAVAGEMGPKGPPSFEQLSLYSMFCSLKDFVEPERDKADLSCRYLLLAEPSLRRCAGPEVVEQLARLGFLSRYFEEHDLPLFSLGQGSSPTDLEENLIENGREEDLDRLVNHFDGVLSAMTPEQHCGVTNCVHLHGVFVLGVLLLLEVCTPEEYAEACMAVHCLLPGVFGDVSRREASRIRRGVERDAEVVSGFAELAGGLGGN